jgi:hypothetical protein
MDRDSPNRTPAPALPNFVAPDAEPALNYCPACSRRLEARSCKLFCPQCGYYMSCADYY